MTYEDALAWVRQHETDDLRDAARALVDFVELDARAQLAAAERERSLLQEQHNASSAKAGDLAVRLHAAEARAVAALQDLDTMRRRMAGLERALTAAEARVRELEGERDALDKQLQVTQADYGALEADRDRLRQAVLLRPRSEWHEDYGDVLWWRVPVEEPPYCGSPLDTDWPDEDGDYYTHFTRILNPEEPAALSAPTQQAPVTHMVPCRGTDCAAPWLCLCDCHAAPTQQGAEPVARSSLETALRLAASAIGAHSAAHHAVLADADTCPHCKLAGESSRAAFEAAGVDVWASIERHAAEVKSWPAWKRGGTGLLPPAGAGPAPEGAREPVLSKSVQRRLAAQREPEPPREAASPTYGCCLGCGAPVESGGKPTRHLVVMCVPCQQKVLATWERPGSGQR